MVRALKPYRLVAFLGSKAQPLLPLGLALVSQLRLRFPYSPHRLPTYTRTTIRGLAYLAASLLHSA